MAQTALPPLAPVPPSEIRSALEPDEWQACLDAWLTLVDLYLRATEDLAKNAQSCVVFLTSYYGETASLASQDQWFRTPTANALHKSCFLLADRLLCLQQPSTLESLEFLSNFCRAHIRSAALTRLMNSLWKRKQQTYLPRLQTTKIELVKALESGDVIQSELYLPMLAPVMHASANMAAYFLTGSDFLDAVVATYVRVNNSKLRRELVIVTYLGLLSLNRIEPRNVSLLSDHLYSLKSQATTAASLLADLVTNTPLLAKLRRTLSGKAADRILKLLDELETYRSPSLAKAKKTPKRRGGNNKSMQTGVNGEMHIHRMSLVTQIQDLFPDLGAGFILRLLDEYREDVEQVTAHMLDDSLPDHLRDLDRSEPAPIPEYGAQEKIDHLAPGATPPLHSRPYISERRNVFDDDEFDRLELDEARLHVGKRNRDITSQPSNKASILSALAAFDSDDDERDDTYDEVDVGGTVDNTNAEREPGPAPMEANNETDMALFATYKSNPELFGRTFDVRRGQARAALKAETHMTDEAIEGWAIMLQRDLKRLKRLELQMSAFDGKQNSISRTAYRESPGATETEDSDALASGPEGGSHARGRGGSRPRGRGRGGRGGGSVAGPSGDASTAQAQRRKEASKGSRANHNRRDQRARKLARGGFAG